MAIAPTGAIFKTLKFDGKSSGTYGVYISGEAVFNAPERDVEMITIPNRNGSFALDNGRFENIEVTYPAGIFADNETDFAQAISDFRNFLCSKRGYCRLTDDYNPDEYRMAIYKSGLEVTPAQLKAGEFEITFECKPQRFLTSGETAVTITSGSTITNPTLFPSSPLIEFTGYGDISLGTNIISVENVPLGDIVVLGASGRSSTNASLTYSFSYTVPSMSTRLNVGDELFVKGVTGTIAFKSVNEGYEITKAVVAGVNNATAIVSQLGQSIYISIGDYSFTYGTSGSFTGEALITQHYRYLGATNTYQRTHSLEIEYDGSNTFVVNIGVSIAGAPFTGAKSSKNVGDLFIEANSTATALTTPCFIDLDLGEAWNNNNGTITTLNNVVQIPAVLPQLEVGNTLVTYDNTFISMKIAPRWWKI